MRAKISALIGLVTLLGAPLAVSAHAVAPALPLHHIYSLATFKKYPASFYTNAALFKALSKSKTLAFPVSLGSGSAIALNKQLKLIALSGFQTGQSAGIVSQAVISTGALHGELYFGNGGIVNNAAPFSMYFGSNPNNTATYGVAPLPGGATNIFTLASASSGLAKGSKVFENLKLLPTATSGAQRAYLDLYKGVARSSIAAGAKSVELPGTVLGGVFNGRYYISVGSSYYYPVYTNYVYAFGNSAFNNAINPTISVAGLKSYIEFANGKTEVITNAGIFSTLYGTGMKYPFYEALGSNPLNSASGLPFYNYSLKSYIYF